MPRPIRWPTSVHLSLNPQHSTTFDDRKHPHSFTRHVYDLARPTAEAATMTLRAQIPAVYWYFCTAVDPLFSLSAVYLNYFDRKTFMVHGFAESSPFGTITPSHTFLMHQSGGLFAALAFMMFTILRETNDMRVWTRFQQALCLTDVAVMFSQWKALQAQGRLGLGNLRWEEGSNAVLVAGILLIRLGFVAGVGFKKGGKGRRRN
jgi:uncharacterized membrane protein